ncbi:hypothetical protein KKP90_00335 [Methanothermococcus sp. SCGC AD-155-E23]|nr:hypothetical protein [Methanothermococcus sp. SCGC AD-155-E23]
MSSRNLLLIFIVGVSLLSCHALDVEYKWASTIPVKYIPLSSITTEEELNYYLNNKDIVVFYIDNEFNIRRDEWKLYKLNITRVIPERIPDYGEYLFVDLGNSIVLYPEGFTTSTKKYVFRDDDGGLIYCPPKPVNNTRYVPKHVPPIYVEVPGRIPEFDGYALIVNGTFVLYPKKYVIREEDGSLVYHPPMNASGNRELLEVYGYVVERIPEYYNYTLVSTESIFILYPKKYIVRTEDGTLIYNPPVEVKEEVPVYNITTRVIDGERGIFEIKPKKILITSNIDPDSKEILDFVGYYVSEHNGTFAYINKVPPRYRHTLVTAVAVQRAVLDEKGDYIIEVAGRKLKVDWRDDQLLNKKIRRLKALSKLLRINITYISTGDELLDIIENSEIDREELEELLNTYWFKKRLKNIYFHTYVSSLDRGYYTRDLDILSMGYYPNIYVHKAPETFKNDPIGGFYPETISYVGTVKMGYWGKELNSENEYYYHVKDEPGAEEGITYWYYQGRPVSPTMDFKLNEEKYKYFNHWFVKNYGNTLTRGADGLLLPSSDRYLLDAVLGRDNKEINWKLDIEGKVEYIVMPGKGKPAIEGKITLLKVPGIFEDLYGVPYIKECYIPPEEERPGVYIGDIVGYNYSRLYYWKDNYTWICSFRDYARWIRNYIESGIFVKDDGSVQLITSIPVKVTIYTKNVTYPANVSVEEYSKDLNKVVLYLPGGSYQVK